MNPIELRRLDLARNMARFYRLAIEPDLFGGVRLSRQWGRIGWRGVRFIGGRNSKKPRGDLGETAPGAARLGGTTAKC